MRSGGWVLGLVLALTVGSARADELTVSAAASLVDAFGEIATAYQRAHPGTRVHLNTAASGVLLQQISHGAPVDVFASADALSMEQAAQRGLIVPAQRFVFAGNTLVVVVPLRTAAATPRRLQDLAAPAIKRIAMGNPDTVPAGRYARSGLEAARLWQPLADKRITAQNVRQALDYVARGEVDAGFVYGSDAQAVAHRVRTAFVVPLAQPIQYPIAQVARSANAEQARRFIAYVRSPAGQAVLLRHGFAGVGTR